MASSAWRRKQWSICSITKIALLLLISECVWILPGSSVAGQLSTVPNRVANGVLSVCPGENISITCTHTTVDGEHSRWEVDGPHFNSCVGSVNHRFVQSNTECNFISFTDVSSYTDISLMSTAVAYVTQELDDAIVKCLAGPSFTSPQVGNVTINVYNLTPTVLSSHQLSTDSTLISWNIPLAIEAQFCNTSYAVNITGVSVMIVTGTSLTLSTGDGISVNTLYTYTVTSNPGGSQSDPGNFNITNNPPSSPSLSQGGVTVVDDGMCSLTSVSVTWEPPMDDPITTSNVSSYWLNCTLEGSTEDVCNVSGMITGTTYQIPVSNFQQLGNYLFSVRANNTAGVSDASEISYTVSTTTFNTSAISSSLNGVNLTFATNRSCSSPTFQVMLQQCLGAGCTCTSSFVYTDPITESTADTTLSVNNLVYNTTYCYRATLTVAGTIVGIDDGMFVTLLPVPPLMLNNGTARLVSSDPVVVYECVNSIEGFNGNSRQIEATFNQTTGEFSVPRCSVLVYVAALIAVVLLLVLAIIVVAVIVVVCLVLKKKKNNKVQVSGTFKTKQSSKIIVEQHDYMPGNFELQEQEQSKPSEPLPPLYADPEDLVQSRNIDRHAMVNMSKKKERPSEDDSSPYEEPFKKGVTITTKDGEDSKPKTNPSTGDNPVEEGNPACTNMYESIGKPSMNTQAPPPPPQGLYSEVFDARPRGKPTVVVNKSTLPRDV